MAATETTPEVGAVREAPRQVVTQSRRQFVTDAGCIADRADARALGLRPDEVYRFKGRHGLPRDQRLSADARALLALERETAERVANGEQLERAQARALIAERATPEAAAAVAVVVPRKEALWEALDLIVWVWDADAYLLHRLEALTGNRYASPGTARKRCEALAPAAAPAAAELDSFRRALFWGVVLRLDQLEGPAPADPAAFYSWSQLIAFTGHGGRPVESLGDLLAGRMQEQQARSLLHLPASGPLPAAVIRDAFRAQARQHHPDAGGDRHRFEQLAAARDRLLMGPEVAAAAVSAVTDCRH